MGIMCMCTYIGGGGKSSSYWSGEPRVCNLEIPASDERYIHYNLLSELSLNTLHYRRHHWYNVQCCWEWNKCGRSQDSYSSWQGASWVLHYQHSGMSSPQSTIQDSGLWASSSFLSAFTSFAQAFRVASLSSTTPISGVGIVSVTIDIADINDNSPTILNPMTAPLSIFEVSCKLV